MTCNSTIEQSIVRLVSKTTISVSVLEYSWMKKVKCINNLAYLSVSINGAWKCNLFLMANTFSSCYVLFINLSDIISICFDILVFVYNDISAFAYNDISAFA